MHDPFPRLDPPSAPGWQAVQEGLARIGRQTLGRFSGLAASPRAPLSRDNPVCRLMRAHPEAGPRCAEQCDAGVDRTLDTGRTQLFTCHARLAVFITRGDDPRAGGPPEALLGGKVFLSYEDVHAFRRYADALGLDPEAVAGLAPDVRVADLAEVKAFAEQARSLAAAFLAVERQRERAEDGGARLRYLMEILAALEKEPTAEVPRSVLHGLCVLFGAPAGVVLAPAPGGESLAPTTVFCGNGGVFSEAALAALSVRPGPGWMRPALDDGRPCAHDAVYDLLKAGFPPEATSVELFPLGGEAPALVALLNVALAPEDRSAIAVFCRHAGLLLERTALEERLEAHGGGPDALLPALWETSDPETLCRAIVERSVAAVDAEQGSVLLLDPAEERLRIRATHGVHLKYVEYLRIRPGEGVAGTVFATGQPLVVADIAAEPRLRDHMRARYRTRSFASVPIRVGDRALGVLNVADKRSGGAFGPADLRRLVPVAQQAALAIERIEALERTEVLRRASMTDYLTGLLNRAAFDRRLKEEVDRAHRYPFASPLSLLVVDIDDFKRINDTLGFFAGDDCITACARTLQNGTRTIDSVYRRGGEEFTAILPHTSREAALTLAERLVGAIAELSVTSKHAPEPVSFTVSIGLATYPDDADSDDGLFQRANQALHVAKQGGKNRVVTLPPAAPPTHAPGPPAP